ncbi:MAG: hypothetical protein RLZZ450_5953, partial [Pseudomonadota bacterium]
MLGLVRLSRALLGVGRRGVVGVLPRSPLGPSSLELQRVSPYDRSATPPKAAQTSGEAAQCTTGISNEW